MMKLYKKRALAHYDCTSKKTNLRERRERAYGRREVWEALNKPDNSAYYTQPKYGVQRSMRSVLSRNGIYQIDPWWKGL